MKLKPTLLKYDPFLESRNIISTIVLYGVFVMALLFSLLSTADMVDRFVEFAGIPHDTCVYPNHMDTFPEWVAYNYRKGWIFGWLIGIAAGICNYRIIRGNRDGLWWMFVTFFPVCMPSIFVELEEFLYFSLSILTAVIVYWAFLLIPKNGKTYWSLCKPTSNWLRITAVAIAVVWAFMLISSYHHFQLCR